MIFKGAPGLLALVSLPVVVAGICPVRRVDGCWITGVTSRIGYLGLHPLLLTFVQRPILIGFHGSGSDRRVS